MKAYKPSVNSLSNENLARILFMNYVLT